MPTPFVAGAVSAISAALIPFYTGQIIDFASIEPDVTAFKEGCLKLLAVAFACAVFTGMRGEEDTTPCLSHPVIKPSNVATRWMPNDLEPVHPANMHLEYLSMERRGQSIVLQPTCAIARASLHVKTSDIFVGWGLEQVGSSLLA